MKRLFYMMLVLSSIIFSSCSQEKPYTVTCHCPNFKADSVYAYMVSFNTSLRDVNYLDSALIVDEKVVFTGMVKGSEVCAILIKPNSLAMFLKEAGNIAIVFPDLLNGSPLNLEWYDYRRYSDSINSASEVLYRTAYRNPELTETERAMQLNEIVNDYCTKIMARASKVMEKHKEDALGQLVFWMDIANNDIMDRRLYMQKLEEAGPYIAEYGPVKAITKTYEAQDATSEGKMFTDFTIEHGNLDSTEVKLSDYAGKGKVLLVDFWASWCGPCRRAMPKIAEAYKTFPSDKFEVLSIAVWDEHDDTLAAIEGLGMEWNHIIDAGSIPSDIYGVNSIPHLMLIGADGTIIRRGLAPDNIISAVEGALAE